MSPRDPYESIASEAVARWLAAKVAERRNRPHGATPEWQAAVDEEWAVAARRYATADAMYANGHAVDGLMVELRADPMFRRQP